MKHTFLPAIFVALLPFLANASWGEDTWVPNTNKTPTAASKPASLPPPSAGDWAPLSSGNAPAVFLKPAVVPATGEGSGAVSSKTPIVFPKPTVVPVTRQDDWATPGTNKAWNVFPKPAVLPVARDKDWGSLGSSTTPGLPPATLPPIRAGELEAPISTKTPAETPAVLPAVRERDWAAPASNKTPAIAPTPAVLQPFRDGELAAPSTKKTLPSAATPAAQPANHDGEGIAGWRTLNNAAVEVPAPAASVPPPTPTSVPLPVPPSYAVEQIPMLPSSAPYAFLVDIKGDFLDAAIAQTLERDSPVQDYIMGTRIVGTSQTRAQANFRLLPSPGPAHLELFIAGTTISETVGYNGPVAFYTTSTIPFRARKRLALDKDGLEADIWRGKVDFESQLNGISTCSFFDRIVRKIAAKKYQEGRGQAEAAAREKAEDTIVETLDKETGPQLKELHNGFVKRIDELKKYGIPTDKLVLRSTETTLEMRGVVTESPKAPAPFSPERFDVSVRLNESFVNQISRSYAGRTIKGDDLEKDAESLFGAPPTPKTKAEKEDQAPWSLTFAKKDPITAVFTGREMMAIIRIDEFTSGDTAYSGMNVTAKYKFVDSPKGIIAVRQGKELDVVPPTFVPKITVLTGRELTMRTILRKRFSKIFTEEIQIKDIEMKGEMAKAGTLKLSTADTRDGWLTIAWTRVPAKK